MSPPDTSAPTTDPDGVARSGDAMPPGGDPAAAGPERAPTAVANGGKGNWRERRRRHQDDVMVPEARFESYYGRNIVKPAPWNSEIPAYLYLGGLAAGSGLIAVGAEATGRTELRRNSRFVALGAVAGGGVALVADLGKPSRFYNMLRTFKVTSPMSVGTWIFSGYAACVGVATAAEVAELVYPRGTVVHLLARLVRPIAGVGSAVFAPPLAAYTATLLANTSTPTWHESYHELPFVFVGSALGASGGAAMLTSPASQTAPARYLAVAGSVLELAAEARMERRLGLLAEPLHEGRPGRLLVASKVLAVAGAGLALLGGRSRAAAVVGGIALNVASALVRFGIFEGGIESAKDPKYTVVPQRERLERNERGDRSHSTTLRPG